VKLSLSGSLYRLRARRRLEQATPRHGEVMGLLKKLRPAYKTIADCRTHNLTPLRQVCRTLTLLCKQLDLFGAELVAIDGSTCRAVNAQERPCTQAKRTQLLAPIDERVAASRKELARRDDQEERGTGGGPPAAALEAKIAALKQRKLLSEGCQAQLRSTRQAHLSLTAPESRAMHRGTGRGPAVCDNVPTAVEAKPKRMVACEVTTDPGDRDWLSPRALQAKEELAGGFDAVADVG
jgi:hypothetical protein